MDNSNQTPSSDTPTSFAFIIGAMKSGTTSLFTLLEQHPQVAGSREKEPNFFSKDIDHTNHWDQYLKLWDWYPKRHKIALEASTSYSKAPLIAEVPKRIALSPAKNVKFIYMMRNPINRIASQVRHSLFEGWGKSLDEGMTDDLIYFSRYAMQIDQYTAQYPREDILLLTLEDLHRNPEDVLRRTCNFLGVSSDFHFVDQTEIQNTGDFFNLPPMIASLIKNSVVKAVGDKVLRGKARSGIRRWLSSFGSKSRDLGRWQLNEKEKQDVLKILAPDLERLENFYGIDVGKYWPVIEAETPGSENRG